MSPLPLALAFLLGAALGGLLLSVLTLLLSLLLLAGSFRLALIQV